MNKATSDVTVGPEETQRTSFMISQLRSGLILLLHLCSELFADRGVDNKRRKNDSNQKKKIRDRGKIK